MFNISPSIFYCDITDIDIEPNILCLLPEERQRRIKSSLKPVKAKQIYVSSLLTYFILEKYGIRNAEIKISDNGKPYIDAELYFNMSHSGKYVVLAIASHGEIGIDIQEKNSISNHAAKLFFGDTVTGGIPFNMKFYYSYIWCRKEALLKCFGTGWNVVSEHNLPVLKNSIVYCETKYYLTDYVISKDYFTTLCEKNNHKEFRVEEVSYRELELFCKSD